MSAAEALATLLESAAAASAATLLALALRRPLRRAFGAEVAYAAWALVPLAAWAVLLPTAAAPLPSAAASLRFGAVPAVPESGTAPALCAVWLSGALACMVWFGAQQYRFRRGLGRLRARADGSWQSASCAGLPATLGLWRPRIVVPAGFDRYDAAQRAVMLAHERGHIARGDPCANAVAAALRCLFWFDPLLHFAARHFRHDQELACDQRVVARHPQHRRAYGEAMLQIQLAAQPLPLGCHWGYSHPLKERIEMLKRPTPTVARRFGGGLLVAACVGCASFAAWALQPAPSPMNPTSEASLPAPKYPAGALAAKVSGKVVLLIDLDANGVPTQVQVERSEPAGVFDAAAVSAARQWRFEPSRENGRAVPGRVRVPVTFEARGQPGAPAGGSGMARALPTPAAVAG